MSTAAQTSTHSTTPSAGAHASGRSAGHGARRTGSDDSTADPFSSLLSMLSASDPVTDGAGLADALTAATTSTTLEPASPDTHAPTGNEALAMMMGWLQLPSCGVASDGATASARAEPGQPGELLTAAGTASDMSGLNPGPLVSTGANLPATATPTGAAPAANAQTGGGAPGLVSSEAGQPASPTELTGSTPTGTPGNDVRPVSEESTLALDRGQGASARKSPPQPTDSAASGESSRRPTVRAAAAASAAATPSTQAMQQSHALGAIADRAQWRIDIQQQSGVRSTLSLDERFNTEGGPGALPSLTAGAPASAGASTGPGGQEQGSGAFDGQPETGEEGSGASHESGSPETDTSSASAADESPDVWASPNLRQASLRVGEEGEDAIDVQLSMKGQDLDLAFRTDNADVRAELARQAGQTLSELLQRGGIQLGSVSVGAQTGQQEGHSAGQPGQGTPTGTGTSGRSASAGENGSIQETAQDAVRPRSDGSRPLDLFV